MACGPCAADTVFLFINIAFAMYSGALLSTAARLCWDPTTYTWLRFLCEAQYRAAAAYCLAAGAGLAVLTALAAAALRARAARPGTRHAAHLLTVYCIGVVLLALSEVAFCGWLGASLAAWWRAAPQAELARRAHDLLEDVKPALRAVTRYRDLAQPMLTMIEEVEREAPNNVYVMIVFILFGIFLQICAVVVARRLRGRGDGGDGGGLGLAEGSSECEKAGAGCDSDSEGSAPPPGWRKQANIRMYTILDKIF